MRFLTIVSCAAVLATSSACAAQMPRRQLRRRAGPAQGQLPATVMGQYQVQAPRALMLHDAKRGDWPVDLDVYLPAGAPSPLPVVLFSHGYGGTKTTGASVARAWASHGYAVITMTHKGSDLEAARALIASAPRGQRQRRELAQQGTSDPVAWLNRPKDLSFIVDQLPTIERTLGGVRLDTTRIAVTGHSMGGFSALTLAGATFDVPASLGGPGQDFRDPRVKVFVFVSPQGPGEFGLTDGSYVHMNGSATLTVTGTRDFGQDRQPYSWRLSAYRAMPAEANDYALIIPDAEHGSFLNDPRFMTPFLEVATRFLDAYLRGDTSALTAMRAGTAEPGTSLLHK